MMIFPSISMIVNFYILFVCLLKKQIKVEKFKKLYKIYRNIYLFVNCLKLIKKIIIK